MEIQEIPKEIISKIRALKYDPEAFCSYEIMSGSLIWSDEITEDIEAEILKHDFIKPFRILLAYRASLVDSREIIEWRNIWQKMYEIFPNWPFFMKERRSTKLKYLLEKKRELSIKELNDLTEL